MPLYAMPFYPEPEIVIQEEPVKINKGRLRRKLKREEARNALLNADEQKDSEQDQISEEP